MTAQIRVLVVDDSAAMRGLLSAMLRADPGIAVVGEAADAIDARRLIKALDPDVVTLDIEMPGMDGIAFLEKIMALRPMPVVIVSSATERGAATTVRALEAGAFACFLKPCIVLGLFYTAIMAVSLPGSEPFYKVLAAIEMALTVAITVVAIRWPKEARGG